MSNILDNDWQKRLKFAALPHAVRVEFKWKKDAEGASFDLRSFNASGEPIGDGADYDLLKARFNPLQALAEHEGFANDYGERRISLDLLTGMLTRSWS
ncbi:MAG: hypothetical protein AAGF20_02760 [Pseudomonadota bacterium]